MTASALERGLISHGSSSGVLMMAMRSDRFDAVITAHHEEIYRYLLRVTACPSTADDLSQDTFLRAFKAFGSLPRDANVRAWLFAIATNLSRNHFRSEKRRKVAHAAMSAETETADERNPEQVMRSDEAKTRILGIVATLPLKQRLAFTMRKFHVLEYNDIGQSLGCSAESARANVFQALKKIRQDFASCGTIGSKR
jgi:RNA polymerase sigma-70 factor (ECF subfamily)